MSWSDRGAAPAPRRGRGDAGAALVEFTFVSILLLTIVFAIINFGLILSFKQDMTRAAAEGARAAAVSLPSSTYGASDPRRLDGVTATEQAVDGFDQTCGSNGMTCAVQIHDCDYAVPTANLSDTPDSNGYHSDDPTADVGGVPNTAPDCVTVKLVFDYDAHPLIVPVPMIAGFLPDTISATSVARLNQ